jgi:hypothetical protein
MFNIRDLIKAYSGMNLLKLAAFFGRGAPLGIEPAFNRLL